MFQIGFQLLESLLGLLFRGQVLAQEEDAVRAIPPAQPDARVDGDKPAALGDQRKTTLLPFLTEGAGEDGPGFFALSSTRQIQHVERRQRLAVVA